MRTLHVGLQVAELERSLAFYKAVGYEVVGEVPETPLGHLTMLRLPGDSFVTLELVHNPAVTVAGSGGGLSHLVIQVDSLDTVIDELAAQGIDVAAATSPDGTEGFRTAWITDPDGRRFELVQWPPGHPDGMTAADWPTDDS